MRAVLLLIGLVGGVAIGVAIWGRSDAPATVQMQCRPSSPERLPNGQNILFWGNSLAFDHGWSFNGFQSINCARQGLTAQAARTVTSQLPDMEFAAVVIVFGTVELVRDIEDTTEFGEAILDVSSRLHDSYPNAKLIVLGVPDGRQDVWSYAHAPQAAKINALLRGLENTFFLDSTAALSDILEGHQTYDGVHLTPAGYAALEREIFHMIEGE